MKKFNAVLIVLVSFFFGLQSGFGQNTLEINKAAFESTASLKKQIKFNTNQEDQVYEAYKLYQRQLAHLSAMEANSLDSQSEEKKKVYSALCDNLKNILTEEQYDVFLFIEKQ